MLIKALDVWSGDKGQSKSLEDTNCLKENVLLTAHAFIHISLGQYEGFVSLQSKQVNYSLWVKLCVISEAYEPSQAFGNKQ